MLPRHCSPNLPPMRRITSSFWSRMAPSGSAGAGLTTMFCPSSQATRLGALAAPTTGTSSGFSICELIRSEASLPMPSTSAGISSGPINSEMARVRRSRNRSVSSLRQTVSSGLMRAILLPNRSP
jgi:hypothetical protein